MNRLSNYVRPFLLLLLFSPFIYYKITYLPQPIHNMKTYQQFSGACSRYGMLAPPQEVLPDGETTHYISLRANTRWSPPDGYGLSVVIGDPQTLYFGVDCTEGEILLRADEEYRGVAIEVNEGTGNKSEGIVSAWRKMEFSAGGYYYTAVVDVMFPEEKVSEEDAQVLSNIVYSLIQQQAK